MPINKDVQLTNGAVASYHSAASLDVNLVANTAMVVINSHANQDAANNGLPIVWQWRVQVSVDQLATGAPSLLDEVEIALVTSNTVFSGGIRVTDQTASLDVVKARKNDEVSAAYQAANLGTFTFQGKVVDYDSNSQINMTATNGIISLTQAMPENWPGVWKAADNSYIAIPDIATWISFYKAMSDQGTANFMKAQQLKAAIQAAASIEDLLEIKW